MNEPSVFPRSIRIPNSDLILRYARLFIAAAACFLAIPVFAVDPAPASSRMIEPADANTQQPCVLLRNGSVLFGSAAKIGDVIYVTRDDKSTMKLPGKQVATIGQSLQELYEYRCKNRVSGDLKRIQADIRWSLRNGLVWAAAEDVLHARTLDPSNPQTNQLLRQIAARMKQTSASADQVTKPNPLPVIQTVSHETDSVSSTKRDEEFANAASPLPGELSHQFRTRIQPILMNRCAGCHVRDETNEREFQIHSALKSKWAPKIVAKQNLQAVMRYVNRNNPGISLIRQRATDGHGGNRRSFGNAGSPMTRSLDLWLSRIQPETQDWIAQTSGVIGGNVVHALEPTTPPRLAPLRFDSTSRNQPTQVAVASSTSTEIPKLPASIESLSDGASRTLLPSATASATAPARMRRMPKVENPFDPEIFNRQFHRQ